MARELQPRVVVMDCAMPGATGLAATRDILRERRDAVVLMLSMHDEETLVRQALDAGARGYLLKSALDLDLAQAVRRAAAGETVLDPALVRVEAAGLKGDQRLGAHAAGAGGAPADLCRPLQSPDRRGARPQREHGRSAPREHHERARSPQDRRAGVIRDSPRAGDAPVNRRAFLGGIGAGAGVARRFAVSRAPRRGRSACDSSTSPPGPAWRSATTAARTAASCCRRRWEPAARSSTTTPTAGRTSCS